MMMKKIIYILSLGLLFGMPGCSMDFEPTASYSDKTFWYSAKNAESGLNGCFLALQGASMYGDMAFVMEECATPNAYNYANTQNWNDIAKGSHTADGSIFAGRWKDAYSGIGRCNMLLDNIDVNLELSKDEILQMKAQARFLRAFYYSVLATYYYTAPLVTDSPDISQVSQKRASREQLISFILKELKEVSEILPRSYSEKADLGRPTCGAALALKARMLLFEASPLCNPDNAPEKWRAAAEAAKEVMDLGVYTLYRNGYGKLFTESAEHSVECIFNVEFLGNPNGMGHSIDLVMRQHNSCIPVKNFIDSYWMKDAKPRSESAYSESAEYENLDPRFYETIVYPGSTWMGETVKADNTNIRFTNYRTGFIYKKYTVYTSAVPSSTNQNLGSKCSPTNLMLLRYADVLLMYAEAMNELGEMTEIIWNRTVKAIRQRAGFSSAAVVYPGDGKTEEIREHIRYERRIEFAGEGTWYNDLRRWKEAENAMDNLTIRTHDGIEIETRHFNKDRDYWWPVPTTQIEIAPTLAPNNPGW